MLLASGRILRWRGRRVDVLGLLLRWHGGVELLVLLKRRLMLKLLLGLLWPALGINANAYRKASATATKPNRPARETEAGAPQ